MDNKQLRDGLDWNTGMTPLIAYLLGIGTCIAIVFLLVLAWAVLIYAEQNKDYRAQWLPRYQCPACKETFIGAGICPCGTKLVKCKT